MPACGRGGGGGREKTSSEDCIEAQNELALFFLANDKPEGAIYWLELAAKQGHADAMHWLGRCYIEGKGLAQNVDMGIMWLSKAAASGHIISRHQIDGLCSLAAQHKPHPHPHQHSHQHSHT